MDTPETAQIPEHIMVSPGADGRLILLNPIWPRVTEIAESYCRTDREHAKMSWPYLTLRFANAHAVYRVGTCERGRYTGCLVEGYVS